jgi:hypothetical protein
VERTQRPLIVRAASAHEGGLIAVSQWSELKHEVENPLKEIPRAILEFANERPAGEATLQPQRWTLKQVFTGRAG